MFHALITLYQIYTFCQLESVSEQLISGSYFIINLNLTKITYPNTEINRHNVYNTQIVTFRFLVENNQRDLFFPNIYHALKDHNTFL